MKAIPKYIIDHNGNLKKVYVTEEPEKPITLTQALDYEIRSSWWAQFIWFEWGQNLAASYFLGRARRKHERYIKSIEFESKLKSK